MIGIENLFKSFGKNRVLNGIRARFEPGKIYGIVGENGAGKTTLFRCIAGLESYSGTIRADLNPLKDRLGLLFTDPYFPAKVTGREYLRLLCLAREQPVPDLDSKNIFDLPLDEYAGTYSTGMKKKLAINAILLQGNEYFIFDEPFNGVDIQSNLIITELLLRLKQMRKTVLLSSHIFATLKDTCDEILLLRDGSFEKPILREEFDRLEAELRSATIGDRVDRFWS